VGCLVLWLGCSRTPDQSEADPSDDRTATLFVRMPPDSVTSSATADDGQWIMPAKNFASTRYSGLDQITTDNVKHAASWLEERGPGVVRA
jgi:glucose dehydrogenase